MNTKTKNLVTAAMLAALACVATMVIQIPSPLQGYINLGDPIVLLTGCILSPGYAFLAAGLGPALADLFSGYVVYAPATFLIKGAMALVMWYGVRLLRRILGAIPAEVISGVVAEVVMICGYYIFEGFLYGFAASVVNIPANAVQGAAGVIVGIILTELLKRSKLVTEPKEEN